MSYSSGKTGKQKNNNGNNGNNGNNNDNNENGNENGNENTRNIKDNIESVISKLEANGRFDYKNRKAIIDKKPSAALVEIPQARTSNKVKNQIEARKYALELYKTVNDKGYNQSSILEIIKEIKDQKKWTPEIFDYFIRYFDSLQNGLRLVDERIPEQIVESKLARTLGISPEAYSLISNEEITPLKGLQSLIGGLYPDANNYTGLLGLLPREEEKKLKTKEGLNYTKDEQPYLEAILKNTKKFADFFFKSAIKSEKYFPFQRVSVSGKLTDNDNINNAYHPLMVFFALNKFPIIENSVILSNIGEIVYARMKRRFISGGYNQELLKNIVTDPNDVVCSIKSGMQELLLRQIIQLASKQAFNSIRDGKYFTSIKNYNFDINKENDYNCNDSIPNIESVLLFCRANILEDPDLIYRVGDEIQFTKSWLSPFGLRFITAIIEPNPLSLATKGIPGEQFQMIASQYMNNASYGNPFLMSDPTKRKVVKLSTLTVSLPMIPPEMWQMMPTQNQYQGFNPLTMFEDPSMLVTNIPYTSTYMNYFNNQDNRAMMFEGQGMNMGMNNMGMNNQGIPNENGILPVKLSNTIRTTSMTNEGDEEMYNVMIIGAQDLIIYTIDRQISPYTDYAGRSIVANQNMIASTGQSIVNTYPIAIEQSIMIGNFRNIYNLKGGLVIKPTKTIRNGRHVEYKGDIAAVMVAENSFDDPSEPDMKFLQYYPEDCRHPIPMIDEKTKKKIFRVNDPITEIAAYFSSNKDGINNGSFYEQIQNYATVVVYSIQQPNQ